MTSKELHLYVNNIKLPLLDRINTLTKSNASNFEFIALALILWKELKETHNAAMAMQFQAKMRGAQADDFTELGAEAAA